MTLSTKPEVYNVRNTVTGEPSHGHNHTHKNLKFSRVVSASGQTDRQTNRRTHHNTCTPPRGVYTTIMHGYVYSLYCSCRVAMHAHPDTRNHWNWLFSPLANLPEGLYIFVNLHCSETWQAYIQRPPLGLPLRHTECKGVERVPNEVTLRWVRLVLGWVTVVAGGQTARYT